MMYRQIYCDCPCHTKAGGLCGFEACCAGQCEGCGRGIHGTSERLKEHRRHCLSWWVWAKKQKRKQVKGMI
jgi:hypothetical protein